MTVNLIVSSKSQPYEMEYQLEMSYAEWIGLDKLKRELFISEIIAMDLTVRVHHDIEQVEDD